jgi:UDP-2,3-diacylglucosamine pyrophosphatase LpxH
LHGDLFDAVVQQARWLAIVGDRLHTTVLHLNRWLNALRARLGFPYWSFAKYVKLRVKNAVSYIVDFEHAVAAEARLREADGVVCGHIHKAEIRDIDGILYCNDGDWVESLTALVEAADGSLRVLSWHDVAERTAHVISSGTREEQTLAYITGH